MAQVTYLTTQSNQAFSANGGSSNFQTLVFLDGGGVTFSNSNGSIAATVAAGGGAPLVSAGTTSNSLSQIVFSNSNNVSFGLNGSTITASATFSQSQSSAAFSAPGGSSTFGTLVFVNTQGVSFSNSDGSVYASVQTNYLTTAAQSNQVVNSINGSTGQISLNVGSSLSSSTNGSSITFGLASNITTALQSTGNYLTTAAQSNQVVNSINGSTGVFTFNTGSSLSSSRNGNSITWGLASNITTALQSTGNYLTTAAQSNQVVNSLNGSTGVISLAVGSSLSSSTNGSTITFGLASNITTALQSAGNYLTTARASNDAIGLNTAQTNVVWTVNSSGISFNAEGYAGTGLSLTNATATLNSLGLQLSIGAGGGTTNQTGPNIAAGSQTGTSGTIVFSNSNNITFGMSNSSIVTASYNNIDIGISNIGNTAGTTGTFDGGALQYVFAGTNDVTLSQSSNGASVTLSIVGPPKLQLLFWDNMGPTGAGIAGSSGTINVATRGTVQNSVFVFPIGELPGDITCNTFMLQMSHSASGNSSSAPKVFTVSFGVYTRNVSTLSLLNSATVAYSIAANAANSTAYSGIRWIPIVAAGWSGGVAPTFSKNIEYFGAMVYSTGGNNSIAQTAGFLGFYPYMTANVSGVFGVSQTTGSSQGFHPYLGVYSVSSALPTNIGVGDVLKQ